jgi:hypothetical protein
MKPIVGYLQSNCQCKSKRSQCENSRDELEVEGEPELRVARRAICSRHTDAHRQRINVGLGPGPTLH